MCKDKKNPTVILTQLQLYFYTTLLYVNNPDWEDLFSLPLLLIFPT